MSCEVGTAATRVAHAAAVVDRELCVVVIPVRTTIVVPATRPREPPHLAPHTDTHANVHCNAAEPLHATPLSC